jgi:hypothetical protein
MILGADGVAVPDTAGGAAVTCADPERGVAEESCHAAAVAGVLTASRLAGTLAAAVGEAAAMPGGVALAGGAALRSEADGASRTSAMGRERSGTVRAAPS